VARLNEAVEKQEKGGTVWMQLFLPLAHHRLDRQVSGARVWELLAAPGGRGPLLALPPYGITAKEWLGRASKQIQEQNAPGWGYEILWRHLRLEAEALVNQASGTGDASPRARP
jgi:hypothetical protein